MLFIHQLTEATFIFFISSSIRLSIGLAEEAACWTCQHSLDTTLEKASELQFEDRLVARLAEDLIGADGQTEGKGLGGGGDPWATPTARRGLEVWAELSR